MAISNCELLILFRTDIGLFSMCFVILRLNF